MFVSTLGIEGLWEKYLLIFLSTNTQKHVQGHAHLVNLRSLKSIPSDENRVVFQLLPIFLHKKRLYSYQQLTKN